MIKELYESILAKQNSNSIILEIFKTGSQLFRNDPSDLDFIAICENYEKEYHRETLIIDDVKYDLIIQDTKTVERLISFESYIKSTDFYTAALYNYFYSIRETVYGSYNIDWDIFECENIYIKYLKGMYKNTIGKRIKKTTITKSWVHYYIILKIFKNKSLLIDSEMKKDILQLYYGGDACKKIVDWVESELDLNKIE